MDAFQQAAHDYFQAYVSTFSSSLYGTEKQPFPKWKKVETFENIDSFKQRVNELKLEWPELKEKYGNSEDKEWKGWIKFYSDPESTFDYAVTGQMIANEDAFFKELACLEANSCDIALIVYRLCLIQAYITQTPFICLKARNL